MFFFFFSSFSLYGMLIVTPVIAITSWRITVRRENARFFVFLRVFVVCLSHLLFPLLLLSLLLVLLLFFCLFLGVSSAPPFPFLSPFSSNSNSTLSHYHYLFFSFPLIQTYCFLISYSSFTSRCLPFLSFPSLLLSVFSSSISLLYFSVFSSLL